MAAQEAVVLENHLKLFVETKVGEGVSLEFTTGRIFIKPVKKQGSTTLGSFWVRVIQAYFPSPDFTYKKSYNSSHASEVLMTVTDGYAIKIHLKTGLVIIEGDVVYEWFKVIFRKVVQHYDRSTYSLDSDYRNDQQVIDARRETQRKEKRLFQDGCPAAVVDARLALLSADVRMPEINDKFPSDVDDHDDRQLNRLYTGLEAIYTSGLNGTKMAAVKHALMRAHGADEQLFIEYRILNKTHLATTKHISSNFIAGVYPTERVELLITSATFDEEGFDRSQNLHSLSLFNISQKDFQSKFLDKLATL